MLVHPRTALGVLGNDLQPSTMSSSPAQPHSVKSRALRGQAVFVDKTVRFTQSNLFLLYSFYYYYYSITRYNPPPPPHHHHLIVNIITHPHYYHSCLPHHHSRLSPPSSSSSAWDSYSTLVWSSDELDAFVS